MINLCQSKYRQTAILMFDGVQCPGYETNGFVKFLS